MTNNRTTRVQGIVPPLVTPLTDQGYLDIAGLERLIDHVLEGSVHGLFVLGTTGEGPSLNYDLRRQMIRETVRVTEGRVPLFVGISDTVLSQSIALARFAAQAGADYLVAAPPYYFPLGPDELFEYFGQLLAEMPLPTLLYNMPAVTGISIPPQTVRQLLDQENLVGLKDSSGDLPYFESVLEIASLRPDFSVLVGPEHLLAPTLALGGTGGVTGGANIWPSLFVDLYNAVADHTQVDIEPLVGAISKLGEIYRVGPESVTATIARTKTALSLLQICGPATASPITPITQNERDQIATILSDLGPLLDPQVSKRTSPQIA